MKQKSVLKYNLLFYVFVLFEMCGAIEQSGAKYEKLQVTGCTRLSGKQTCFVQN